MTPRNPAVRAFIGPFGLRSGWRVLMFFLITGVIAAAIQFVVHQPQVRGWASEFPTFCVSVLLGTWIMARIDGKSFWSFGLGAVQRVRNLVSGLASGFLGLSLLMGMLVATGAFQPRGPDLHGFAEIGRWALYWIVAFLFVALSEELLTRGYSLFALAQGIGFWPAAVILSLLFGAGHLGNRGEELIGIANAVLAGMVFAYSVRWTGTLWWAIGAHLSWNWGETFFFGVANSGGRSPHHFFTGSPAGPAWLSGGTVGPEGSVLAAVVLLAMVAAMRLTSPRHEAPLHPPLIGRRDELPGGGG